MTYLNFLIFFVIIPLMLLTALLRRYLTREWWGYIGVMCVIAVVWTTPWDNYLVANNIWGYDDDRVIGTIGYVPIEEYSFFVLQTMLTSVLLAGIRQWVKPTDRPFKPLPWYAGLIIVLPLLLIVLGMISTGDLQYHYLVLELGWLALPPFAIQYLWGLDILRHYWRVWLLGVLIPTVWLCAVDGIAIDAGTWRFDPAQITGIKIGVLPLEEAVFFTLTNLLIVQGMILFTAPESWEKLQKLRK